MAVVVNSKYVLKEYSMNAYIIQSNFCVMDI